MSSATRSRARTPNTSSACASLTPPRPTYGMIRDRQGDLRILGGRRAGLGHDDAVDGHLPGQHQRPGPRSRLGQPPRHDQACPASPVRAWSSGIVTWTLHSRSVPARDDPRRDVAQGALESPPRSARPGLPSSRRRPCAARPRVRTWPDRWACRRPRPCPPSCPGWPPRPRRRGCRRRSGTPARAVARRYVDGLGLRIRLPRPGWLPPWRRP